MCLMDVWSGFLNHPVCEETQRSALLEVLGEYKNNVGWMMGKVFIP